MSTLKVAIAGATGYAGEELIRILLQHPSIQLTHLAASAKWDRPVALADVFPRFAGQLDLSVESLDPARLASSCDVAFLALPHGVSMDVVPILLKAGRRIVDLGSDFRLRDSAAYAQWYGKPHTHPELLAEAVYGIPELSKEAIARARLVANPGCYATSIILALAPLLRAKLVEREWMVVDAKSGLTGAGRKAEPSMMFSEMNENLWPYKVNHHQHTPEVEQALAPFAGAGGVSLCFVPHVVPMNRGILSTMYLRLAKTATWDDVHATYRDFYREAPFVRLRPQNQWPKIHDVAGTNYCDLAWTVDQAKRGLIVTAAIDNLLKGAAGQAVQNLNVMAGWPETTGLCA
ncbi:MAG: N-acetyl-gamma-glutamyl-phosphate reductase [Candidatus Omnitrophica bacterium]|nr:N-acetyl-gamma-glutamyl-phosphate reductase [Candidatus Omnitrophota bacterium]